MRAVDSGLSAGSFELELNGRRLGVHDLPKHNEDGDGATDPETKLVDEVASLLVQHKTELLTETLTAFYLSLVELSHPRLAFDVRRTISREGLMQALRGQLAGGSTVHNFPEVLETMLAQAVFGLNAP